MKSLNIVHDKARELQAEIDERRRVGNNSRLRELLIGVDGLVWELKQISWGDFEDARLPSMELPYKAFGYDDRVVREMTWPLVALGHPTNSRRVVGGLVVYTPMAESAGPPTDTPSVVGVPASRGPSIFGCPAPSDDSLRSVPSEHVHEVALCVSRKADGLYNAWPLRSCQALALAEQRVLLWDRREEVGGVQTPPLLRR